MLENKLKSKGWKILKSSNCDCVTAIKGNIVKVDKNIFRLYNQIENI